MGTYDIVHSILTENITVHDLTRQALEMESLHNYEKATCLYETVSIFL